MLAETAKGAFTPFRDTMQDQVLTARKLSSMRASDNIDADESFTYLPSKIPPSKNSTQAKGFNKKSLRRGTVELKRHIRHTQDNFASL